MDPYQRRFGGVGRLFGSSAFQRLRNSHVCIVGLGGVGSWAVEALTRSGVGELTLVDLDDVCISNVNRQLHALNGELGKPKVDVLAQRVQDINPECIVHPLQCFFLKSNAASILQPRFDAIVDAIDGPSLKCLLIAEAYKMHTPIITVGGAGGRRDPTAIEVTDLAFSSHDRLLHEVRRKLRRDYGFPRGDRAFGVECVLSREQPMFPAEDGSICAERPESIDLRLDCNSGFGTACFVTATFGMVAASRIVQRLAGEPKENRSKEVVQESTPLGANEIGA
jgi:tRNA A37 threonylcarbamoyladenosine dehydratase